MLFSGFIFITDLEWIRVKGQRWGYINLEYLHKESSDRRGPQFVKHNGIQILFIQKAQVLTMLE